MFNFIPAHCWKGSISSVYYFTLNFRVLFIHTNFNPVIFLPNQFICEVFPILGFEYESSFLLIKYYLDWVLIWQIFPCILFSCLKIIPKLSLRNPKHLIIDKFTVNFITSIDIKFSLNWASNDKNINIFIISVFWNFNYASFHFNDLVPG